MTMLGVVGQAPVGVLSVKQSFGQQRPNMVIGGRVVDEGSLPPTSYRAGQPELGQVLADCGGAGTDELGETVDRRLSLQQGPQQLDPSGIGKHPEALGASNT